MGEGEQIEQCRGYVRASSRSQVEPDTASRVEQGSLLNET